jgi:predicted nucleic acid-binding protein
MLPASDTASHGRDFQAFHVPLGPVEDLTELALSLAIRNGHNTYGGLYVALAIKTGWGLVTRDEGLYNLVSPTFPNISMIREYT